MHWAIIAVLAYLALQNQSTIAALSGLRPAPLAPQQPKPPQQQQGGSKGGGGGSSGGGSSGGAAKSSASSAGQPAGLNPIDVNFDPGMSTGWNDFINSFNSGPAPNAPSLQDLGLSTGLNADGTIDSSSADGAALQNILNAPIAAPVLDPSSYDPASDPSTYIDNSGSGADPNAYMDYGGGADYTGNGDGNWDFSVA